MTAISIAATKSGSMAGRHQSASMEEAFGGVDSAGIKSIAFDVANTSAYSRSAFVPQMPKPKRVKPAGTEEDYPLSLRVSPAFKAKLDEYLAMLEATGRRTSQSAFLRDAANFYWEKTGWEGTLLASKKARKK